MNPPSATNILLFRSPLVPFDENNPSIVGSGGFYFYFYLFMVNYMIIYKEINYKVFYNIISSISFRTIDRSVMRF